MNNDTPTPPTPLTPRSSGDAEPELKVVDRRWWARKDQAPADTAAEEAHWEPRKPTYVEDLERQLAGKDTLLQEYIARYKDASREFDAVKARIRRDVVKDIERGRRAMLVELLDVVDNLDRAIAAARQASEGGALLQGVEMVRDQFVVKLAGFGVTRMAPLGRVFDPIRHEAASLVPTADPSQDNLVAGIIREGYESGDEVLRPALVAVGRLTYGGPPGPP
jgi:molecular chaperone GrpE